MQQTVGRLHETVEVLQAQGADYAAVARSYAEPTPQDAADLETRLFQRQQELFEAASRSRIMSEVIDRYVGITPSPLGAVAAAGDLG